MTSELTKSLMTGKALEIYERMTEEDKSVISFVMTPSWAVKELEDFMTGFEYESKYLALSFMDAQRLSSLINFTNAYSRE